MKHELAFERDLSTLYEWVRKAGSEHLKYCHPDDEWDRFGKEPLGIYQDKSWEECWTHYCSLLENQDKVIEEDEDEEFFFFLIGT